jgi:hypothetical protein
MTLSLTFRVRQAGAQQMVRVNGAELNMAIDCQVTTVEPRNGTRKAVAAATCEGDR